MDLLAEYPINDVGRDFAVGDIHGHFGALLQGLRAMGFDARRDRLFSVGDLIDRGPDSAQVLNWLGKPWFHAIRGNHEAMAIAAVQGGAEDALFHARHGGAWLQALPLAQRQQVAERLQALPLALEVATHAGPVALVHADLPSDDWPAFADDLRNRSLSRHDEMTCLWSTARHAHRYAAPVRQLRALVHGHLTVPQMETLGNVHYIDTHHSLLPASEAGHFTFLDLATLTAHAGPGGNWRKIPARYR
ncbi:hypothetical protein CCO03_02055 [Comamonas serinivorans]|uniref:Serine/threonine specific protein phosphatases domain-containing protein n=1 Tax=Comamonas serinivorans TaxID=1082851 RepID=A0A1Y0ESD4_9BURK|nr:metallophosphoesterase [Comamonas serinivorans]ARU06584.1 hypothetical protein CCO03_02055 [Comamonas serinivorans]